MRILSIFLAACQIMLLLCATEAKAGEGQKVHRNRYRTNITDHNMRACANCRKAHKACDPSEPCKRCVDRQLECFRPTMPVIGGNSQASEAQKQVSYVPDHIADWLDRTSMDNSAAPADESNQPVQPSQVIENDSEIDGNQTDERFTAEPALNLIPNDTDVDTDMDMAALLETQWMSS